MYNVRQDRWVQEDMLKIDRDDVVHLLKSLIEIESVNPHMDGSGETEVSNFIVDHLESLGMDVIIQDVVDDRSNVIGILRGEEGNRRLMMNGHTDTVGVKRMTIDPFNPVMKNGNIHGRGACDMKGPLVGMMIAAKALVDSGIKLKGDLVLSAVVDEEYKSIGTEKLIQEHSADAVIVGEPTNFDVGIAHKGFVWLEIETYGKAAHGSIPEEGVDAIVQMVKVISQITNLEKKYARKQHDLVGTPKIHTSLIEGGSEWSVVPDLCRLRLERRTIPGETSSTVIEEISQILNELSAEDPLLNAKIQNLFERQPMEIAPDEPIVKDLSLAVHEVRQIEPRLVGEPYWTDASLFVNASIPTCLFGPGDIALAHSADEFIKIDDVIDAAQIYAFTAQSFCGISTS